MQRRACLSLSSVPPQKSKSIDLAFAARSRNVLNGSHETPQVHGPIAFLDTVGSLHNYLEEVCKSAGLHHLQAIRDFHECSGMSSARVTLPPKSASTYIMRSLAILFPCVSRDLRCFPCLPKNHWISWQRKTRHNLCWTTHGSS